MNARAMSWAIGPIMAGLAWGCTGDTGKIPVPGDGERLKSTAVVRAERRAYDGAPPVIPHEDFDMVCTECHDETGVEVPDVGFSPPSPHGTTRGMSAISRCRQCHVFSTTDEVFVKSTFAGLPQDLRIGRRLHSKAPPTIPHKVFMRENCAACHTGPAAREEIRTSHPERIRCRQCHVPVTTLTSFVAQGDMR